MSRLKNLYWDAVDFAHDHPHKTVWICGGTGALLVVLLVVAIVL